MLSEVVLSKKVKRLTLYLLLTAILVLNSTLQVLPVSANNITDEKTACYKKNASKIQKGQLYRCQEIDDKLLWVKVINQVSRLGNDLYQGINPAVEVNFGSVEMSIKTKDNRLRKYNVFTPKELTKDKYYPLIIALHGGVGTAKGFESNSRLNNLAEANGFIVVYPGGINVDSDRVTIQSWNAGDCCGPASRKKVDDVWFISEMLKDLATKYPVDANKIYAVGHSNGGMMAYRLACELPDKIKGIGVQSASIGIPDCKPARDVKVIHIHGTNDKRFPIEGGKGIGVTNTEFRSARYAVNKFARSNNCEIIPKHKKTDNQDISILDWENCESKVRYIIVKNASHAWMGSNAKTSPTEAPYKNLDASKAILSFLLEDK